MNTTATTTTQLDTETVELTTGELQELLGEALDERDEALRALSVTSARYRAAMAELAVLQRELAGMEAALRKLAGPLGAQAIRAAMMAVEGMQG